MIFLNNINYDTWQSKMSELLFVKCMYNPVFTTQNPEAKLDKEWTLENNQTSAEVREVNATSNVESSDLWHERLGHMSKRGMSHLTRKVPKIFEQFHALVERETGKKLKAVRSDNGREYIGTFDTYYRSHAVRHQRMPPKTLQLNGVVKQMNRTLMEMIICLLSEAKLPGSFWAKALKMATYVVNRSPSKPLKGEVLGKKWIGMEQSYIHLRIFGFFVEKEKIEDIGKDMKALFGTSRMDKVNIETIRPVPPEYKDNGPRVVEDNNEAVTVPNEDHNEAFS
ncbi:hypothetical protein Nepgr_014996 [Nepenthes gracilis]|uniref:Integrase catalytic domain-containing protein n=1 Tax=Nepenthes gracilis TaxID=150966 RepID=A0AAD3XR15_NEPGR|nr:hypothetical protein Nepgr_014996 [Nepenthes gracilis]